MAKRTVVVNDKMQRGYRYRLSAPIGRNFDPDFKPQLSPKEILRLGVFCGKYMTDCAREFPRSWFTGAKLSSRGRDCSLNFFGVDASQPLSVWRDRGWINPDDPRGWFQWYCRYYLGGRMLDEDRRQIKRWKAIRRHVRQVQKHCEPGELTCRKRQRLASRFRSSPAFAARPVRTSESKDTSKPMILVPLLNPKFANARAAI